MIPIFSGTPAAASASFSATLLSTLVPQVFTGSSTPTFTRATTAYVTDFEGLLKQSISGESRFTGARRVQNLLADTTLGALWTLVSATRTTGVSDPFGGTGAITLTGTAGGGQIYRPTTLGSSAIEMVNSIYIRRRTGTGAVTLTGGNNTNVTITSAITSSWRRISVPKSTGGNGGGTTYFLNLIMATSGDELDLYLPQMEDVTGQSNQNPSEGVSNGVLSAPYHGAGVDGCKYFTTQNGNTVASNVVTEATGAAISSATLLGYRAEGLRTNLCLQSQTFDNASWVVSAVTVAANQYTAPDGTTTMDKVTASAGAASHFIYQDSIAGAAGSTTQSLRVRYVNHRWVCMRIFDGVSTFFASFDLLNGVVGATSGATSAIRTVSSGVYELNITATTAAGAHQLLLAMNDIDSATLRSWTAAGTEIGGLWGAQHESASFASSYIPTTTVAVARNKDALSYSAASNISAVAGTMYAEAQVAASTASNVIIGGGAFATRFYTGAATSVTANDGTVNTSTTGTGTSYLTAPRKAAMNWGGSTMAISKDGATAVSGSFDGDLGVTSITIGDAGASYELFGTVRNVAIYTLKKTDAELATLTT